MRLTPEEVTIVRDINQAFQDYYARKGPQTPRARIEHHILGETMFFGPEITREVMMFGRAWRFIAASAPAGEYWEAEK